MLVGSLDAACLSPHPKQRGSWRLAGAGPRAGPFPSPLPSQAWLEHGGVLTLPGPLTLPSPLTLPGPLTLPTLRLAPGQEPCDTVCECSLGLGAGLSLQSTSEEPRWCQTLVCSSSVCDEEGQVSWWPVCLTVSPL